MINKVTSLLKDREFILYALIGLTGVAIDFVIYLILVKIGISPVVASFISVSIAIINNFILNRHYNFKKKDHTLERFASFYLVGFTGVLLSIFFIFIIHNIFGVNAIIAKLISVPFIVLFQYWFNKNASFAENYRSLPIKAITIFIVCISTLALFSFNGPYHSFTDEDDNLLGAQFIAQGDGIIYKDYFSHHMPLTYFLIAPLFIIFGTNLIAIKVLFGLVMGTWLLLMSRHILNKFGIFTFSLFPLIIAFSQMLTWSNMVLAETFISFAIVHAIILFITRSDRKNYTDVFTLLILGSIPILSALSYAPLSIAIYLLALFMAIERIRAEKLFPKRSFIIACIVTLLPYILLFVYLYTTHSFGEMKQQALTFNTLFYSQFSSSAATTPIDAIATILQGTFQSYKDSISFQGGAHPQPLSFLFTVATTLAIVTLFMLKKHLLGSVFIVAVILSASRFGFGSTFSSDGQARSGMLITFIGTLCIILVISYLARIKQKDVQYRNITLVYLWVTVGYIIVSAVGLMATAARDYQVGNNLVQVKPEPGSASTVINLVNRPSDYYWVGPLDFASQIFIKSNNASEYRFYAPWHSACGQCTDELIKDIDEKHPNVISLNTNLDIWGYGVAKYSERLRSSYENEYYQVSDPRLIHYRFLKKNQSYINNRLEKAGYVL